MRTTVTVYTSGPSCMACRQTKRHLDKRGIEYTEVAIDSDDKILDAADFLGLKTAPIVVADVDGREFCFDGYRPDRLDEIARAAA